MKTSLTSPIKPCRQRCARWWGLILLSAALPVLLRAATDDFNDGDDDAWTPYAPLAPYGVTTDFSFPNGGYRIQTLVPSGMPSNPGRAGSLREDLNLSDFYVAVDVVGWNDTTRQAFGVLGRVSHLGLGQTRGYAFTYERGSGVTPTSGGLDISRLDNEVPTGIHSGTYSIHFDPAKDYRLVFLGRGAYLEGRVYELPNLTTPLITVPATDSTYPTGHCGLVVYDNSGGGGLTDATFDNFYFADQEAPRLSISLGAFPDVIVRWPLEATGFMLQWSPTLPATSPWTDLGWGDDLGDGYWSVYENAENGTRFYRLYKP